MFHIEHTPRYLDEIHHHKDLNQRLKRLATFWKETPHIIFSGPCGSGKKTIVKALMREIYGDIIDSVEIKQDGYLTVLVSPVHIEYYLTKKTSRKFIDDLVSRVQAINVRNASFHTVVLHGLSDIAEAHQTSLRKIFEKYTETARFITVTRFLGRVKSVQNRSLCIRVKRLTTDECTCIFEDLSDKTKIPIEKDLVLEKFEKNDYNLLDTLISVDRHIQLKTPLKKPNQFVSIEEVFDRLISSIRQKNPKLIQTHVHELIVVPLSASVIFKGISKKCMQETDGSTHCEIARLIALYDWKSRRTSNVVYVIVVLCYHLSAIMK